MSCRAAEGGATVLDRTITRRQAIKAGGIGVAGRAFSKPLIETVLPRPALANYVGGQPAPGPDPKMACDPTTLAFNLKWGTFGNGNASSTIP